jgi:ubiquitin-like protein ATG12
MGKIRSEFVSDPIKNWGIKFWEIYLIPPFLVLVIWVGSMTIVIYKTRCRPTLKLRYLYVFLYKIHKVNVWREKACRYMSFHVSASKLLNGFWLNLVQTESTLKLVSEYKHYFTWGSNLCLKNDSSHKTFIHDIVFLLQFLYVNQSFAPAPDHIVKNLYDCYGTDGKLVLHYCKSQAWGWNCKHMMPTS